MGMNSNQLILNEQGSSETQSNPNGHRPILVFDGIGISALQFMSFVEARRNWIMASSSSDQGQVASNIWPFKSGTRIVCAWRNSLVHHFQSLWRWNSLFQCSSQYLLSLTSGKPRCAMWACVQIVSARQPNLANPSYPNLMSPTSHWLNVKQRILRTSPPEALNALETRQGRLAILCNKCFMEACTRNGLQPCSYFTIIRGPAMH